jgi:hypothetical protein
MRRFVLGWKQLGHEKRWKAYIVNYADDLVICCRTNAEEALVTMRGIMTKLKLTVNETKTRVCKLPEEKFEFLGYSFGRCYSPQTGRAYLGTVPSKKRGVILLSAQPLRDNVPLRHWPAPLFWQPDHTTAEFRPLATTSSDPNPLTFIARAFAGCLRTYIYGSERASYFRDWQLWSSA